MTSLPKTVTRQRRGCDLNPGPSAPESSMLTTRLPSHPIRHIRELNNVSFQFQPTALLFLGMPSAANTKGLGLGLQRFLLEIIRPACI